jgi:DNA-binding GntR family transcriptional regulator
MTKRPTSASVGPKAHHVPMSFATSSRSQLRDAAAVQIRELILAGLARPGQLLRLAPLAEHIDASVTPVREALLLLAQDGWVIQEPNRGFRVAAIRRSDVDDAYLVHAFVAGQLASRAARLRGPEEVENLRRLDREIKGLRDGDDLRAEQLNYELHDAIYAIAESPRLVLFVTAASRFVPRRYWATIPGWTELNRRGHKPIIDAVKAGDEEKAGILMSEHIRAAGKLLIAHLDTVGFWEELGETRSPSVGVPELA